MEIQITRHGPPTIDEAVLRELLEDNPRTFMVWNSRYRYDEHLREWEPRWVIWKELKPSRHPKATNERYKSDVWNSDFQCWTRKLQTYMTEAEEFAAADRALITGLAMANSWASRLWYEEMIEEPFAKSEEDKKEERRVLYQDATGYYDRYSNPIVGRHANSGWRWRIN